MKKVLIALVCATAIVPLVSALTIVPRGGPDEDLGGCRKRLTRLLLN